MCTQSIQVGDDPPRARFRCAPLSVIPPTESMYACSCRSHYICSISSLNPAKRTRCSILFEHTQVRAVRPTQLLGIRLDCAWTTLGSRPSDSSCHSRSAVAPVMVNPTRSLRWSTPASAHSAARRVQLLEHPCECTLRCKACPVQFCSVVVADLWLIHSCERTIRCEAWRCSDQPAVS